jgi:hypothetical protein
MIELLIYLCIHLFITGEVTYYCSAVILEIMTTLYTNKEKDLIHAKIKFYTKLMHGFRSDTWVLILLVIILSIHDFKILKIVAVPLILITRLIIIWLQYKTIKRGKI